MDKQGYQMPVQDKEVSAFLDEPSLTSFMTMDPDDVSTDQDQTPHQSMSSR